MKNWNVTAFETELLACDLDDASRARLETAFARVADNLQRLEQEASKDGSVEYYATVKAIAQEAFNECADDEGDAYDRIHESVDGSYWVIYYHAQRKVLEHTSNDDAWREFGDLPMRKDWLDIQQYVAFCAMQADCMDEYRDLVEKSENNDDDNDND